MFTDDSYITQNPLLHDPRRLWKTWFLPGSLINYFPITFSLQYFQWLAWGRDTFGYHLTNVLLHITNSLLLWRLFSKLGLRYAWLGGCLFLVYPTQVESVAWVSEFKNTLSLVPFIVSLISLCDFCQNRRSLDLVLSVVLFSVAMLCKTSMAMFPFGIVLYEWWKQRSIGRTALTTALPYFAISTVLGAITLFTGKWYDQRYHALPLSSLIPLADISDRFVLAGQVIGFYVFKVIWPFSPSIVYPQWAVAITPLQMAPSILLFLLVLCLFWRQTSSFWEYPIIGFGWFVIMLLPFVDLIPTGNMPFTWVMDHFLYLPLIGPIWCLVKLFDVLQQRYHRSTKAFAFGGVLCVVSMLAGCSHEYAKEWVSQTALFTSTLERNPQAWIAHYNLGLQYAQHPITLAKAVPEFKSALQAQPGRADYHSTLADTLAQIPGHIDEAITEYNTSLELNGRIPEIRLKLAQALAQTYGGEAKARSEVALFWKDSPDDALHHDECGICWSNIPGHSRDAIFEYERALMLFPDDAEAHDDLGASLAGLPDQLSRATGEFREAIRLRPNFPIAEGNLGNALLETGNIPAAVFHLRKSIQEDPMLATPHYNFAALYMKVPGGRDSAISELRTAISDNPFLWQAHVNLGNILALDPNRYQEAASEYRAALSINDGIAEVHNDLGLLLQKMPGHQPDAVHEFSKAIQMNGKLIEPRNNLGVLFGTMPGMLPSAISEYKEALALFPKSAILHLNLGNALARTPSERQRAINEFQTALELDPSLAVARDNLDLLLKTLEETPKAN